MRNSCLGDERCRGFTRIEAITAVGILTLLLLLVWAGIAVAGETRRIFFCKHRLHDLSGAFADYERDHNDSLPPAVFEVGDKTFSWDTAIASYFEPQLERTASQGTRPLTPSLSPGGAEGVRKALLDKVAAKFKCPSDTEPRGPFKPRSYSMPMYDLNKVDWPPDEICGGGLGLYLDAPRLEKARKAMPLEPAGYIPAIKTSMVPAPADTALLVERISIENAMWATKFACIVAAREQFNAKTIEQIKFHRGKMNYLMLDGHVELLLPAQSAGFTGTGGGLWTIREGD